MKQDRAAPRTVADIERKYNFGKSFAEILGMIDDTRDKVDSSSSELRDEINKTSTSLIRDTTQIVATATANIKKEIDEDLDGITDSISTLSKEVEQKITADGVTTLINHELETVKKDINGLTESVSTLSKEVEQKVTADGVTTLISHELETVTKDIDGLTDSVTTLTKEVESKLTPDAATLLFRQEIEENGVSKVKTETGYVFDSEGLKINKSGEEMTNLIDNTGMYVTRGETNMLTANSTGVTAIDLHAKTYLKIGSGDGRCRFEDYGTDFTGCFWTGG